VLVEQVNGLHPEPLERGLGDPLDLLWPAIQANPRTRPLVLIVFEPEFGGDHHLSAERLQRFAHEFFDCFSLNKNLACLPGVEIHSSVLVYFSTLACQMV
jgi:hypothetical protein